VVRVHRGPTQFADGFRTKTTTAIQIRATCWAGDQSESAPPRRWARITSNLAAAGRSHQMTMTIREPEGLLGRLGLEPLTPTLSRWRGRGGKAIHDRWLDVDGIAYDPGTRVVKIPFWSKPTSRPRAAVEVGFRLGLWT
jgi:hypothetical protein